MVDIDWKAFGQRFSGSENTAFEWLCYLLFCKKYDIKGGILRYFNNPGIETTPIEHEGEVIGWQAKFYRSSLSDHASAIINTLEQAKRSFPKLSKLIFFCNQDFGFTTGPDGEARDSEAKRRAESKADELGIELEWFLASHFESPFVTVDNAIIAEHFFNPYGMDVLEQGQRLLREGRRYFDDVQVNVTVASEAFAIDRSDVIEGIRSHDFSNGPLILAGESGMGKTAIVKLFQSSLGDDVPFLIVNCRNAGYWSCEEDLLGMWPGKTLDQVQGLFGDASEKYVLLDSAEHMEIARTQSPIATLLDFARGGGWGLITTTRPAGLRYIGELFAEAGVGQPELIEVSGFRDLELKAILKTSGLEIAASSPLAEMLRRPIYVKYLDKVVASQPQTERTLRKAILDEVLLQSACGGQRLHRRSTLYAIAEERLALVQRRFQVDDTAFQELASEGLVHDGDSGMKLGFSHDLVEELVSDALLDSIYESVESEIAFLAGIGSTRVARRAYRHWLSRRAPGEPRCAAGFLKAAMVQPSLSKGAWLEETIAAILGADEPDSVVALMSTELVDNDWTLYGRFAKVLHVSCMGVDNSMAELIPEATGREAFTMLRMPIGAGWGSMVRFAFDRRTSIPGAAYADVLSVAEEWTARRSDGRTTRMCGLLALELDGRMASDPNSWYRPERKAAARIIARSCGEMKAEAACAISALAENWDDRRVRNSPLAELLQSGFPWSCHVAMAVPDALAGFLMKAWFVSPPAQPMPYSTIHDLSQWFGLPDAEHEYYPPSAYQTPMYALLKCSSSLSVQLVVDVMNHCAATMLASEAKDECFEIRIPLEDGGFANMVASARLWNAHLDISVVPNLYASVLMAFEKWILELADTCDSEQLETICFWLLKMSRSASIASIVTSVVIAYPEKCLNVLCALLACKEVIGLDRGRLSSWKMRFRTPFFPSDEVHARERRQTESKPFRESSLEEVALKVQIAELAYFEPTTVSNRIRTEGGVLSRIYAVIDGQMERLGDSGNDLHYRLLYARIDSRNMRRTYIEKDGKKLPALQIELPGDLVSLACTGISVEKLNEAARASSLYARAYAWWKGEDAPDGRAKCTQSIVDDLRTASCLVEGVFLEGSAARFLAATAIRDSLKELDDKDLEMCVSTIVNSLSSEYESKHLPANEIGALVDACTILAFDGIEDALILLASMLAEPSHSYALLVCQAVNKRYSGNEALVNSLAVGHLMACKAASELSPWYTQDGKRLSLDERVDRIEQIRPGLVAEMITSTLSVADLEPVSSYGWGSLARVYVLLGGKWSEDAGHATEWLGQIANGLSDEGKAVLDYELLSAFSSTFGSWAISQPPEAIERYCEALAPMVHAGKVLLRGCLAVGIAAGYSNGAFASLWQAFLKVVSECWSRPIRTLRADDLAIELLFADPLFNIGRVREFLLAGQWASFFENATARIAGPGALYAVAHLVDEVVPEWIESGIGWLSSIIRGRDWKPWDRLEPNTVPCLERISSAALSVLDKRLKESGPLRTDLFCVLDYLVDNGSAVGFSLRDRLST